MSRLFSRHSKPESAPTSRVLTLSKLSKHSNATLIHEADTSVDTHPSYSAVTSHSTKPNVLVFRGEPHAGEAIGEATYSSLGFSSKIDMSLHGQSVPMKLSQLSGNFSLEYPPQRKLKWHTNKLTGSTLELFDDSGTKLAKLKSHRKGEGQLEIFVPCDDAFFDLILVSAMSAKAVVKEVMEALAIVGSQ